MDTKENNKADILEDLGVYHIILVELADEFKHRLQDAYEQDSQ